MCVVCIEISLDLHWKDDDQDDYDEDDDQQPPETTAEGANARPQRSLGDGVDGLDVVFAGHGGGGGGEPSSVAGRGMYRKRGNAKGERERPATVSLIYASQAPRHRVEMKGNLGGRRRRRV